MRRVYSAAAAFICFLTFYSSTALAQAGAGLSITNYQFVSEQRVTRTQWYVTYTADLVNSGPKPVTVTATVTTSVATVQVVAGQGTLHFPVAPAGGQVTSLNTFTILVDRSVPFSFDSLQWSFLNPVANAGPNQTATVGNTVNLSGAASTNPSGTGTLTYSWAFTSAPTGSKAQLSSMTAVTTSFVVDMIGTYVVTLTVSNGVASDSASVTINAVNSPPVANAGPNQTVSAGSLVTLNGSASTDVDGDPLTYSWSFVSLPLGSTATLSNTRSAVTTFVADLPGLYVAQLVVNDGLVNSLPATVTITTNSTPPVANAGPNQKVNVGALVQLNGSGSTDVNGKPLTYQWSFNSKPAGSTAVLSNPAVVNPTFTADLPGTYVVQLVVSDGVLPSLPATVTVTTNNLQPPTANAGMNQTVTPGTVVQLNGSGTDPQGLPLTYMWSLTTRPPGSSAVLSNIAIANPTFVADKPGTYIAQLIVSDGFLSSAPVTVTITNGNTPPVAVAGLNQTVSVNSTVTLDGSGSSDADGHPLTYSWSLITLPTGSTTVLQGANTVSPHFLADVAGVYVAQLIVNDGFQNSPPSTVMITASAMKITLTPNPLNLSLSPASLTITLGQPAGSSGVQVNLSGFNPAVISVPTFVTVPANSTGTNVTVTPVAAGTTAILASASGFQAGSTSVVVSVPSITIGFNSSGVGLTHSIPGTITLTAPAAVDTVVALTSNPMGGVTFTPPSVTIPAGGSTGTFSATGGILGTATITAASGGYVSGTVTLLVVNLGVIGVPSSLTIAPGQSANFAVTLSSPAPVDGLTVNLVSGNTSIVTVTPSVYIAPGATSPATPAQVTGVQFGQTTVTANAGGYTSAGGTVTVSATISFSPQAVSVGAGGDQSFTLLLSAPAPAGGLPFTLTSNNTALATVSVASGTIAAGATSATASVHGVAAGSTTITASTTAPNVASGTLPVTVFVCGTITLPSNPTVALGQSAAFPISVTAACANAVTIALSSTDSTIVSIAPATVTIPAGQTQPPAQPQVTGVGVGQVSIIAQAPGYGAASQTVQSTATLSFNPQTVQILGVQSQNLNLMLSGPAPSGGLTVTIAATPSGVVSVPPSVTIAAGATSASVQVTGVAKGTATITGSAASPSVTNATATVTVTPAGAIGLPQNTTLVPGQTMPYAVTLSSPAPTGGVTVTLASSDTTKVSIAPASVVINAGATTPATQPQVTGVAFGTATILGSSPGYTSDTETVTVGASLSLSPATYTLNGPGSVTLTVSLSVTAPSAIPVTITASPSGVVTAPQTVTIAQGSTSATITVVGLSAGTATITAASILPNISSGTSTITVVSAGPIGLPSGVSLGLGQTLPFPVTLPAAAPAGGVTVNLVSDSANVTISPAAVTIAAGQTQPANQPQVTGQNLGTANITASAPGYTSTKQSVAVTGSITFSPFTSTIRGTASENLTLTLSGPAPVGGISFTVTSSNPSVATVGAGTASIAAGQTTVTVVVTGVAPGATTIRASNPNVADATASVTDINPVDINVPASVSVTPGNSVAYPISLVNAAANVVNLMLTTADPTVATVTPSQITVNPGQTTSRVGVTVNGIANGSTTVTVSATGLYSAKSTVLVGFTATITPSPLTIVGAGNSAFITATLSGPAPSPDGITFTLTGFNPAIATTRSSLTIAAGNTSAGVRVDSVALGTTSITFTAPGLPTATVNVIVAGPLGISTSTLPNGVVGTAYSAPVTAVGGSTPYAWTATGLPAGLTIDPSSGVISGVPTQGGAYSPSVTVTDSATPPSTVTKQFAITIVPQVVISTTSLPNGEVGVPYSGQVTATGGIPPLTYSATGLPAGLSIAPGTGLISGTPTTAGPATINVMVTDTSTPPQSPSKQFPVTIAAPPSITSGAPPSGAVNTAYSFQFVATGGTPSYNWTATALPAGLTLNASTGLVSGTPTTAGTTPGTVTVADSNHVTASQPYSIVITNNSITITTTSPLPTGTQGVAYTATVTATGGTTPYNWSATGLPSGLTIAPSTGVISGTPGSNGTSTVNVMVTDSSSPTKQATAQLSLVINPPFAITTTSLPSGMPNQAYTATVVASGGQTPYSWTATGLPSGLAINPSTGVITGTPGSASTSPVTVTATDSSSPTKLTASKQFQLVISQFVITTGSLPAGVQGLPYSTTVQGSGGTTPYNWSATGLPSGLTLTVSSNIATIAGTPLTNGTFTVNVTLTDSSTPTLTTSKQFSLVINPPLTITTTSPLPNGVVNTPYSFAMSATNGANPLSWSAVGLPSPLTINSSTGVISGTPAVASSSTVFITVTDATTPTNQTATKQFSLTIGNTLTITTPSLPAGAVGLAYSTTVQASGGITPYNWTATGLPSGLTLTVSNNIATIAGTPVTSGPSTVNVTVTDSSSPMQTNTKQFTLTIAPVLAIGTTSLPNGAMGLAYSAPVAANGGNTPLAWSATGLPAGLAIDPALGTITGTPTAGGTFTVNITVTDATSPTHQTATKTLQLAIAPTLAITTTSLPGGVVNAAYSAPVAANAVSGVNTPLAWSATGLPAGLAIDPALGTISGTPTAAGTFPVNITVTDSISPTHQTANKTLQLIVAPVLAITTTTLPNGAVGLAYSTPVASNGVNLPLAWSATGLPAGLTIDPALGTITGTPTSAGTFTGITITVTDSTSPTHQSANKTVQLIVAPVLAISTTTLPTGAVGAAYSAPVAANGVNLPLAWSATGLPSGLAIDPALGTITGTPTAGGTFTVNITVTDATSPTHQTATKQLTLTVGVLAITSTTPLPAGTQNTPYSYQFTASGGVGALTWTCTTGCDTLPRGMSFSSSGLLSGTPVSGGAFTLIVTVVDSATPAHSASKTFSLTITTPPLTITTTVLPFAVLNQPYINSDFTPVQLAASGGSPAYQWTSSKLPLGLTLSNAGVISGTPTVLGTTTVTFTVTDNASNQVSANIPLTVAIGVGTIGINSVSVGQNLEVPITITFTPALPVAATVTISSSDPTRIVLGDAFDAGTGIITPQVPAGSSIIQTYVQALGSPSSNPITISASLPGYGVAQGTVTIGNSGFVLDGGSGVGAEIFTYQGATPGLTVYSGRLDSSNLFVETENVRPGYSVSVPLNSSDTTEGTVSPASVTIGSGNASATATFNANTTKTGFTTISIVYPISPFTQPSAGSTVLADIQPSGLIACTPNVGSAFLIGNNLQADCTFKRVGNLEIPEVMTITSSDASRLLLSTTPTGNAGAAPAAASITVTFQKFQDTYDVYFHAHGSSGLVPYTISGPDYGSINPNVTLAPSGLVIQSPTGVNQSFSMLSNSTATLFILTAALDGSGNVLATENVAVNSITGTGTSISASVVAVPTNPSVGTILTSPVSIATGFGASFQNAPTTVFQSSGVNGSTSITASATGFSTSPPIGVTVGVPAMSCSEDSSTIGQFLEATGSCALGASTPAGGTQFTLSVTSGQVALATSSNGTDCSSPGTWSNTITVNLPAGSRFLTYCVESLASTGSAAYSVTAPGYKSATSDTLTLVPSAIVFYPGDSTTASISKGPQAMALAATYLDSGNNVVGPQPLAVPANVSFTSSNATAGTMASVTFPAGTYTTNGTFKPGTATGTTTITVVQPSGFTPPNGGVASPAISITVGP